jgi:hypothetical protein
VLDSVNARLAAHKKALGLNSEVKWEKTDRSVVERYEKMMRAFFDEIAAVRVVVRIMFTQNSKVAIGLESRHYDEQYYLLYYQFLKHGFGLRHMPIHSNRPRLRIYLDELGDTDEQISQFRGYVSGITNDSQIRRTGLILAARDIVHVRSHDHILMQCLDVVLGSMTFRLNNKHKEKPVGKKRRGKRTVAKDRLYKFINKEICRVTGKRFNIGISTGLLNYPDDRWAAPYLHWLFEPSKFVYDPSKSKP